MPHFSEESRLRFTADLIQLSKDERGVNHYSCFMSLKQKGRDLWKKTGIPRFARKLPISKQMRLIGIKFGSSVLSYYKLVRMLIVLNFLIFVLWVVWAIVPWFEHYDHHTYRIPVAPFSVLEEVTVNQALNITSLVPVTRNTITMHRTPDGLDIFRNVLGIPDPQVNEYSWWYYSGYSVKFKDYEMGSTYVLLCLGSFLLSLLLVVYLIGSGLAKGNQSAVSDSDTRLPLSLYAWDWEVQDPQAVEEKMLGCWMQVQAEYHNSMRAHDYFVDQSVRARRGQYDPWEVVTIVEIDGHDYWVQKEGGVRFSITDTNNIEVILKCGMKPRTIRRVCGTILSFLLCGGSVVGFYYALFYKESLDSSFPLTSSLVVKGINLCIPFIQRKIVKFEKIRNPQDAVKQEVIRVFVIKMAGLVFLFLSLKSLGEDSNDETCPEYLMGATYLQLMVTDFYVDLGMTTCKCFALQRLVEPPRKQDFVVSTEVINVLYRQCLMWMGSLYAPMVTFHAFVLLAVLFFVKTYCMFLMNKTPSQPMAEDGTGAFLYFMLLASMGVSGVPFFHFMKSEKMHCGPHLEPNCYDNDVMRGNCKTPLQYLNLFVDEAGMTDGTDWVFSSVILFFSCIALLVVAYLLSLSLWSGKAAAARRIDELNHEIKSLRQELREAKGIPPTSPGLNSTLGSELLKSIPLPPAMPPPGQLSPVVSPASPPSACPEDPQATLASVETAEAKVEGDGARCVSADDFEEKL